MISSLFNTLLYEPLYNGLVFLVSVVPGGDIGIAVVILTILVKFAILPLSHKSIKTQAKIKEIEPEMSAVREKYKKNKQEQALKTMELYRKHGVNPFGSFFLLLVQLPIIFALYWVFWQGLKDGIHPDELYSFVKIPESLNMLFLGIFDLGEKSWILALIAGISQYFQTSFATPPTLPTSPKDPTGKPSFRDEFMKSFNIQMKYGLPVVVFFVSYVISGAIALYWATSNIFTIIHELYVRHKARALKQKERDSSAASV